MVLLMVLQLNTYPKLKMEKAVELVLLFSLHIYNMETCCNKAKARNYCVRKNV